MPRAMLLAAMLSTSIVRGTVVTLDDFEVRRASYRHTLGGEFPGAKASFSWCEEGLDAAGALRIEYDFTEGGRYCQWVYSGWIPPGEQAIIAHVRGPIGARLMVRVVDGTGQYHQFRANLAQEGWSRIEFPLERARAEHWAGANDGVIHPPLKAIFIGTEVSALKHGTVLLDSIALQTRLSETEVTRSRMEHFLKNAKLSVESARPGLLFWPQDDARVSLSLVGVPKSVDRVSVQMACTNAFDAATDALAPEAQLLRQEGFRRSLTIPTAAGYYEVAYKLTVQGTDGQQSGPEGRFSFGLIPASPADREPQSPFGVNTHFNQGWNAQIGEIVKKAGIAWIRDGEASLEDRALPVAMANNLCYVPCFTWYRKPLDENRDEQGNWDFSDVAAWHGQYAKKYGENIDAYDLVNEPHGGWSEVLGGDWSGGSWQEVFVKYGRQVTEAIKAADPGATVLWEDIDQLLWYRKFHELGAAQVIDVISPHPYNMHRSRPLPEEHPILHQLPQFTQFAQEKGLAWRVWSGEVGFSAFRLDPETRTGFYSPHTELQQAQRLVRMMVSQLAGGVERIFWYDFLNDGTDPVNPEHNFGLIRNDRTPKPAIVAYSYLISRLRGCRWLGRYSMGGGADAFAFAAEQSGEPVIIAWLRQGEKTEALRVPGDVTTVTVTDMFGASTQVPVQDHKLNLELSETPVYVDGLGMEDVRPLL